MKKARTKESSSANKGSKATPKEYSFKGNEFHFIANAGAILWQYCLDTNKTPAEFAKGLKGLSKVIDSNDKSEVICQDKMILIGCFEEALK